MRSKPTASELIYSTERKKTEKKVMKSIKNNTVVQKKTIWSSVCPSVRHSFGYCVKTTNRPSNNQHYMIA